MQPIIQNFIKQKNYPQFELKAVFFDMDGVLFNSMPFHAGAWVKAMKYFKLPFSLYDAYMNEGRTGDSTIDEMFLKKYGFTADSETKQKIYAKKSEFFNQYKTKPKPIPDVFELLKMLKNKGLQIFVVTGSAQVSLLDTLDEHFPNIFEKEKVITAFDVKIGKPNPEPYLMALQRAGVEPYEAAVIENAPLGVRSAVAAGILTVGVNTGILKPEEMLKEGAAVVFPNMRAVIEALR
jgi:HAD superfamily hydrolase (TIGR01509 family)